MKKILIIDDSQMDLKLIQAVIRRAGIENDFLLAHDGDEGLQMLSKELDDIGLVLLDWQMPKVDGMEFLRASKFITDTEKIPVVMVTASGTDDNKKFAWKVNPNLAGYIVKPFNSEVFIETIKPFL